MKKTKIIAALVIASTLLSMNPAAVSAAETTNSKTEAAEAASTVKGRVIEGNYGYSYCCDENGKVHKMYNGRIIGDVTEDFIYAKNGDQYIVNKDGMIATGMIHGYGSWHKDDRYYADENGVVQKDKIITYNGKKYLCTQNGAIAASASRWSLSNGEVYNTDKDGVVLCNQKFKDINGKYYYLDDNGQKLVNTYKYADGTKYFMDKDGVIQTGLFEGKDGLNRTRKYFADEEGILQYDKIVTDKDGKMYYCGEDAAISNEGYIRMDKDRNYVLYYADKDGVIQTGFFINNEGKRCYAAKDGIIPEDAGKITASDGKMYIIHSMGNVIDDPMQRASDMAGYYYLNEDASIKTGFFRDKDGNLIYANKEGFVAYDDVVTADDGKQYLCLDYGRIPEKAGVYYLKNSYGQAYEVDDHGVVLRKVK